MIAGARAADGTQAWMLATGFTADGSGILANDAASGRTVVLSYDRASNTLGGVTGVLDSRTNAIVPLADAEAIRLAGLDAFLPNAETALQSFAPQSYLAVSVR